MKKLNTSEILAEVEKALDEGKKNDMTVKEAIETLKDDLANIDNNDRLDAIADVCDAFIKTLKGEADAD